MAKWLKCPATGPTSFPAVNACDSTLRPEISLERKFVMQRPEQCRHAAMLGQLEGPSGGSPVAVQTAYVHPTVPGNDGWYDSRTRLCCPLSPRWHRLPWIVLASPLTTWPTHT